jgi:hypothetical protein
VEVFKAIQSRQSSNPKTVLGFYGAVLAVILGGCVAAVWVLAVTHTMTSLIPWIFGAGAIVFVGLLITVVVINLVDPSKLMLGQISGIEYSEIQRARLGDSLKGEREVVLIHGVEALEPTEKGASALPAALDEPTDQVNTTDEGGEVQ